MVHQHSYDIDLYWFGVFLKYRYPHIINFNGNFSVNHPLLGTPIYGNPLHGLPKKKRFFSSDKNMLTLHGAPSTTGPYRASLWWAPTPKTSRRSATGALLELGELGNLELRENLNIKKMGSIRKHRSRVDYCHSFVWFWGLEAFTAYHYTGIRLKA